ncbi:MAG: hypothetical protein JNM11_12695 [Chitinimonas sp.]|nr:hypothetical protein [Chitinimonas sp.]
MVTIYQIDAHGIATGRQIEIEAGAALPAGWVADAPPEYGPGALVQYAGGQWIRLPAVPAKPQPQPVTAKFGTVMTQLAFKRRFPVAKWQAARTIAASGQSPDLADFFEDWSAASYIDLRDVADRLPMMMSPQMPEPARLTQAEYDRAMAPVSSRELPGSLRLAYGLPEIPPDEELAG